MARITIDVADAQAEFSALIEQVESGVEVVITYNGAPVVRLIPARSASTEPDREPGSAGDDGPGEEFP